MRLLRQFQASFFFFFMKIFRLHKITSQAKTKKQKKNKRIRNNKGNGFSLTKTSKRRKIDYFSLWCFFYARNFFVKKREINWIEIVLITSYAILLISKAFAEKIA